MLPTPLCVGCSVWWLLFVSAALPKSRCRVGSVEFFEVPQIVACSLRLDTLPCRCRELRSSVLPSSSQSIVPVIRLVEPVGIFYLFFGSLISSLLSSSLPNQASRGLRIQGVPRRNLAALHSGEQGREGGGAMQSDAPQFRLDSRCQTANRSHNASL